MSYIYSSLDREDDPHALPDVEIWYHDAYGTARDFRDDAGEVMPIGWYWWPCFPGCLPDGDANGPFDTYAEARQDIADNYVFDDDDDDELEASHDE